MPIALREKVILGHANDQVGPVLVTVEGRITGAAGRALDARRRNAANEVELILTAAVRVMERTAPEPPKVSEIVAEAGTCNKTFYRYFTGKDDLVLAVMERGITIVVDYLDAQMNNAKKSPVPAARVARWIEGLLAQVTDPHLFSLCHSTVVQLSPNATRRASDDEIMQPLRDLLTEPIGQMGRVDPQRDADAVFHCTMGTLHRYVGSGRRPPPADVEHLVTFCLSGIGVRLGEATYV